MKKMMMLLLILMCSATSLYAADGDLLVDGKLGIGTTTSPVSKLQVVQPAATAADGLTLTGSAGYPGALWLAGTASNSPLVLNRGEAAGTGLSILYGGKIGIGTAAPYYRLDVYDSVADSAAGCGIRVNQDYSCTATRASDMNYGIVARKLLFNIPNTFTSGGYQVGVAGFCYVSDTNFAGTIADMRGLWARVGIYEAAGAGARTVTNAYGVYIENLASSGTVTNNYGIYQVSSGAKNYFAGKVGIGTTSLGSGTKTLVLGGGTSPGALTGAAGIYARTDTSGKTTIRLIDSDGTDQLTTPHSSEAPDWMYDPDDEVPMIVEEIQRYAGFVRYTNQTRQARLTSMTDAEKSVLTPRQRTCVFKESFEEHNARLGLGGESALARLDWDTEQLAMKSARDAEIQAALKARADQGVAVAAARDANTKGELTRQKALIPIPEEYVVRQMPPRLRAAVDAANR